MTGRQYLFFIFLFLSCLKWTLFLLCSNMLWRSGNIDLNDFDELRRIIREPAFQSMKELPHHGRISCYTHSMLVARHSLFIAHKRGLDYISAAKGGLLHDFYLYHKRSMKGALHRVHHPGAALKNAERLFEINDIVRDAILHHMWPLTPVRPKFPESVIVSNSDKASAIDDYRRNAGANLKRIYYSVPFARFSSCIKDYSGKNT